MQTGQGDLWNWYRCGAWIAVTTNGVVRKTGELVMGKGVAAQALQRFPSIGKRLGTLVTEQGNRVFALEDLRLIAFPTKHDWRSPSDLDLISRSARELAAYLLAAPHITADLPFVLPAPGMGLGSLTWKQIEPRLQPLRDLNVLVIAFEPAQFTWQYAVQRIARIAITKVRHDN